MTALAALARAGAAGLSLILTSDRIRWRGPQPAPELLSELRRHKVELLALLLGAEPPSPPAPSPRLAAELLAAAKRGAAAVATGPADEADAAEADAPAPKPPEAHRAHVRELMHAALLRPPSSSDAAAIPSPGARCSCCTGCVWWCEAVAPSGWRCAACHPPDHLRPEKVREART